MPRSKQQLKSEPLSPAVAARPRDSLSVSVHQFGSSRAHFEPSPLQQEANHQPRAVSVWLDLVVTALWVVPAIGVLIYIVGVIAAIAIASAVIVALTFCLNPAIEHTIELSHTDLTDLTGGAGSSRHVSNGSRRVVEEKLRA